MDGLLGFALTGFALAGSPGPNTLSLAATGAAFGARRGVGYMAGMLSADAAAIPRWFSTPAAVSSPPWIRYQSE